jgi:5-methylcytosine-specific restriction endonuclease McrA
MSQHHKRMTGSARQKRNRRIFAEKGDVCHICGHPGSDAIDHVTPLAKGGSDEDETNLMPAHHDVECDTCGQRCNRTKGAKLIAPIIRRSSSLERP